MKIRQLLAVAVMLTTFSAASLAQDAPRRGGGNRSGGFVPTLSGTWQLCRLTPGQDGQPQLSLLPMLKVFDTDGKFQHIGIPSEGACFIEKHGSIEKTSDSTYVETLAVMRRDTTKAEPLTVQFRFRGPMWLVIEYKEAGQDEKTEELWMRVRPKGSKDARHGGHRQRHPRIDGQNTGRRPHGEFRMRDGQHQQGQQRNQNRSTQVNAFEDDDDSDF